MKLQFGELEVEENGIVGYLWGVFGKRAKELKNHFLSKFVHFSSKNLFLRIFYRTLIHGIMRVKNIKAIQSYPLV